MQNVSAPAAGPPLTAHEALSGVFGSVSLASWIFLLVGHPGVRAGAGMLTGAGTAAD